MDNRKSDTFIVPKKLLITVEGRGVHFIASSKTESCKQRRADIMVNELLGIQYNIAKANVTDRKVQNLASYIKVNSLKAIHKTMDKNKASGIDKVTKEEYERNLEENLENLVKRMKDGSYHPNPTRRVYIPKEAKVFRKKLEERFAKYGLEVAEEKTKVLEFGRFARQNRERRGEGKPDTFDFLGFTFYCGMDGKKQFFRCRVKTSKKKLRSKIKAMKEWIMKHRTLPLEWIFKTINAKLRGHYQYYAVTDNIREVKTFLCITKKLLFKWLNRRSQRRSYTWKTFNEGLLRTFPLLETSIKVSLFYR